MTRGPGRVPPASRPPEPARSWCGTAGTAAIAAVVMLALHTDAAIIAAGLMAAATAGTALAVARLRSRRGTSPDAAITIVAALILATALLVLLGIIMADRPG